MNPNDPRGRGAYREPAPPDDGPDEPRVVERVSVGHVFKIDAVGGERVELSRHAWGELAIMARVSATADAERALGKHLYANARVVIEVLEEEEKAP